jgi:uncharacterized protein YfiM (DUF2279 family)
MSNFHFQNLNRFLNYFVVSWKAFSTVSIFILILGVFNNQINAQPLKKQDSIHSKKLVGVSIASVGFWATSMYLLNNVWYANSPRSSFHTFDDHLEWMQMDKVGHVFSAYQAANLLTHAYTWTGLQQRKAATIGSLATLAYLTSVEYLDGTNEAWGFSWSDQIANTLGVGLALWKNQPSHSTAIYFKQSYSPSPYAGLRPSVLGKTTIERYLKDYNGQTYWLSFSPNRLFGTDFVPKFLLLSLGYSCDSKLEGHANESVASNGIKYTAQRELLVSLDIDFNQVPFKRKWVKKLFSVFQLIKVPLPAIQLRGSTLSFEPVYF